MHHALEIQDILLIIFDQVTYPFRKRKCRDTFTLAVLARTCRAFKEPALDLLWETLDDISPLARCLPEASHRLPGKNMYSFDRPLTQTEWSTLQTYTRRIRVIMDFYPGLEWESATTFMNPPTTGPLFPYLHTLRCDYTEETMPLLHLPLPSLIFLDVRFDDPGLFQSSLRRSFPKFSPDLRQLRVWGYQLSGIASFSKIEPNYIYRWQNLTGLTFSELTLDGNELVHLSQLPTLTGLTFTASVISLPVDTPLPFCALQNLSLRSESWETILRLLSQIRLPAIKEFSAHIDECPSRQDLSAFWARLHSSCTPDHFEALWLAQPYPSAISRPKALLLGFGDLQPWMAFSKLRIMEINTGWDVGLTDNDLLMLTSAWPRLERLSINPDWGWNTMQGITPNGLLRLLQSCRSLRFVFLTIDTRGYTEFSESQESLGFRTDPLWIGVLDSLIEPESVPAVAAFFAGIHVVCADFRLSHSWDTCVIAMAFPESRKIYRSRWEDVRGRMHESVAQYP